MIIFRVRHAYFTTMRKTYSGRLPGTWLLLFTLAVTAFATPLAAQQRGGPVQVNVTVKMAAEAAEKNLILYHPEDRLEISDFRGKPDKSSPGVGATYSGITMEMQGQRKNNIMDIAVKLTVYFDRTKSWMKPEGKTESVLAHEQIHFDLTAVKACALAKAIQQEKFTAENVQQRIRALQASHTAELSRLQQAYDKETEHGTIVNKQREWEARVVKQWAELPCM